jgi:hypothetical protein
MNASPDLNRDPLEVAVSSAKGSISRWKAAYIHLGISLLVAAIVVLGMLFVWYPQPYFYGLDGLGLLILLVSVDVVIGPLITFVVFNPAKKSLKSDLTVVAVLQLAALAYGVVIMAQARPVYAVFNEQRFDVVIASEMNSTEQAKVTNPLFQRTPIFGPQVVAMGAPQDLTEVNRMITSGNNTRAFSQYYVSYQDRALQAGKAAHPMHFLALLKPESAAKVRELIAEKKLDEKQVGWLPFYTRANDMTIVLKRDTGEIVGIVPVPPAEINPN